MTPIAHLWPPAVRAAIAEQRAGIDRLLTEDPAPEQTVVLPGPDGSTAVVTQLSAPAATAPPRRRRWIPAATALCVLGAGAWWFVRTDGPVPQESDLRRGGAEAPPAEPAHEA
ncbi:hypothetical protein [Streptomyces sp. S1]|uniref:hypothetical protein n=1 Tax=Streptomyces sp. S1 TaxID=718288 RepID=UPI003D75E535